MEFDVRTILIIIGFVVIGLIFLDGIRRMRRAHHDSIRMRMDIGSQYDDVDLFHGELPGGGARPAKHHSDFDEEDYNDPIFAPRNADLSRNAEDLDHNVAEYDHLTASRDDDLDIVAEQAELFAQENGAVQELGNDELTPARPAARKVAEPKPTVKEQVAESSKESFADSIKSSSSGSTARPAQRETREPVQREPHEHATVKSQPSVRKVSQQRMPAHKQPMRKEPQRKVSQIQKPKEEAPIPAKQIEELVVFNLMAKPGRVIRGDRLLEAVLACNMRFGSRNIFHRYEQANGDGEEVFSLANVMEPGTFDIHNMDKLETKGICLFLTLPGPLDPIQSFDLLVDSLKILVEKLLCDVKDEHHSALTQQTLEHHRQRIVEYQRRLLSRSTIH